MTRPWLRALAGLAVAAVLSGATARAADLPPPTGPVLVTVAGAVENANRGPVDPFADGVFAYHEIAFERAAAFDLAALEALGMHRTTARYPNWSAMSTFEGPLLADVLAAAGARSTGLRGLRPAGGVRGQRVEEVSPNTTAMKKPTRVASSIAAPTR